jgi:hypothetical protein
MGVITVIGGALGTAIGGVWADRKTRGCQGSDPASVSTRVTALLRVCAIGSLVGAPLAALAALAPTATLFFGAFFVAEVFVFLSTSPINAAVLDAAPPAIRASAMALCIFTIHALGDLWSPPGVGWLADVMPMQLAMLSLPAAIAVSAFIWWPVRRTSAVS